jgi:hypothetical protein
MNDHFVVAYVNDVVKQFSITARTRAARLSEVTLQSKRSGYRSVVIALHLDKATADAMKQSVRSAYQIAGYTYKARKALP